MARAPLRPAPPPADVDLRTILLAGIAVWAVAGIGTGIAWLAGALPGLAPATCLAGVAIGGLGLGWVRRHRARP